MVLTPPKNRNLTESLMPVLEDYAEWFGAVAVRVAYYDDKALQGTRLAMPASYTIWHKAIGKTDQVNAAILKNLEKTHEDLLRLGTLILNQVYEGRRPAPEDFHDLKKVYVAFVQRIRRLEKDSFQETSGMDHETGLRHASAIQSDLEREMKRLSRHGNPFCLAIVRIDFFAARPDQREDVKKLVEAIQETMRSFDDAYALGSGKFLLSLKHTDMIGAKVAFQRLNDQVKETIDKKFSLSACLSEPMVEDNITDLLRHMHDDLDKHLNDSAILLEYVEVSPLQRFMDTLENKGKQV